MVPLTPSPNGRFYQPSEIAGYTRKSVDDRNGNFSLEGQKEEIFATASEFDLPLAEEFVYNEAAGHGGDEYWEGGGSSGLEGNQHEGNKTRPVLTKLLKQVVQGEIRCIVVYSQCRLWRDVAICEHLIRLLSKYDCVLYDRYGTVDISTPEGRNKVRANAVAAQNQREMAVENAPRGIRKKLKRGKLVTTAHRLGFRSTGGGTGGVTTVPDEFPIVERIFCDYDQGKSPHQIARELTDEGFEYLPDVYAKRRKHSENKAMYKQTVVNILKDCRYQGRQPYEGEEHDCPAFLIDGKPLISPELYERVQARRKSRSPGAPSHYKAHALSGLICCGVCGQSLRSHKSTQNLKSGKVLHWHTWKAMHFTVESWCKDDLPVIYVGDVDTYVNTILAPLLEAELHERSLGDRLNGVRDERAALKRIMAEMEQKLRVELPKLYAQGKISLETLEDAKRAVSQELRPVKTHIHELDLQCQNEQALTTNLHDFANMNPLLRNTALRSVLRWCAVMPGQVPKFKNPDTYKLQTPVDSGRVVFLTAWGTMHTAFIERRVDEDHRTRLCFLRPATAEECVGTLNDFPDPAKFLAGLERRFKSRFYFWQPYELLPGWTPETSPCIAEFAIDTDTEEAND